MCSYQLCMVIYKCMYTFISVRWEPTACVCVMCRCIRLENQLFEMQLLERYRKRETSGARHLHPREGWREGEMEEGRDGDKQAAKTRQCERDGGGGEITPLYGYMYFHKTSDTSKLTAAVGMSRKSACEKIH